MNERRVAIVTGANKGIGYAIAKQLLERRYDVIVTSRDAARAAEAAASLGAGAFGAPLDVTHAASVAAFAARVREEHGRVDVLVNNAGVALDKFVSAFALDVDVMKETMETNVYGALRCAQAFVPVMRARDYGRVVNVSSNLGSVAKMGGLTLAYRASKAALNALTRVLADELRATNVHVNSMCPGWVRTELGGDDAPLSPDQGADTAVWLATARDDGPRGGFFQRREPFPW